MPGRAHFDARSVPGELLRVGVSVDGHRSHRGLHTRGGKYQVAGCVGGIYGIGGGSILAPILVADGRPPSQVAPAALSSTFLTSLAGVVTFTILSAHQHGSVAPNWPTGIALGVGGLAGGYVGARLHARMPEALIRRLLALVVVAIGVRFLVAGLTSGA